MIVVASATRIDSLHVGYGLMECGLSVLGANPTRRYLYPEPTASSVVIMTPAGVTMSDPAYLDHVIVIVRPWRCSEDPHEWLSTLYGQIADSSLRRYPTWIRAAESVRQDSHSASRELASFLGNIEAAFIKAAFEELRPQPRLHDAHPEAELLDGLYEALRDGTDLSDERVAQINALLGSMGEP